MYRRIILHNNWQFNIFKRLLPKLLKWSQQDLISIDDRVHLFTLQIKKYPRPHSPFPEHASEHQPCPFKSSSIVNAIRMKLLICISSYIMSSISLHEYLD